MTGARRFIKLKVHAGEKSARVLRRAPDSFEIWVKTEAERGQANAAALAVAAKELGVPAKTLRIIKGAHSPAKIIEVM
jgi:uncharacterized protein YggU (UPF0235/DUF167 family)